MTRIVFDIDIYGHINAEVHETGQEVRVAAIAYKRGNTYQIHDIMFGGKPVEAAAYPQAREVMIGIVKAQLTAAQHKMVRDTLREVIEEWPEFDADEPVDDSTLAEWFGNFRLRARNALAASIDLQVL